MNDDEIERHIRQLLDAADSALQSEKANPCLRRTTSGPTLGSCLRVELNAVRFYDKVREAKLCDACAAAWHVARARALYLAVQRTKP